MALPPGEVSFPTDGRASLQPLLEQLGWSTQTWERWLTGLIQRELLGDNPRPL